MKWLAVLALGAGMMAGAAKADPGFSLGVGGSYWQFLSDDIKDDISGMWGISVYPRVWFTDYVGLDIRVSGYVYSEDEDTRYGNNEATLSCGSAEVGLMLNLPVADSPLSLYGGAGGGYYYYDIDVKVKEHGHRHSVETKYELEDDFGWYGFGGVKIQLLDNLSIFGEARYVSTETGLDGHDDDECDMSGIQYMAGLSFDF